MSTESPSHRDVPASRRRPKPTLSCTLCRRRKLKCDRQQPCKTCVDRGLSLSCTFTRSVPASQDTKPTSSVHDRINQLERLVTTLMSHKDTEQHSPALSKVSYLEQYSDDENNEMPETPGRVKLSNDTTTYTNSSHWTSILDGISELKEHLDHIPTSAHARDIAGEIAGPDLLFGRQRHATRQELLAALPPRREADHMVAAYFESMQAAPSKYNAFWSRPFETPTMWLGLFYAVLSMGARFQAASGDIDSRSPPVAGESLYTARMDFYREKVVQAMILANYTKCPPYTVQTSLLYFGSEFSRSPDTQFGMWVLVGMIVRMAFRMGYHRDPSRFANISPFEGEIRRRAWLVILSVDLVSSAQVGLPRMIQPFMYDTQEPRNVPEDDLYEDMTELPPSQPETELTPLLYTIVMTRVRMVHAKVMDLNNATSQPPYREIMNLDAVLRHVYDKAPESSKAMPRDNVDLTISSASVRRLYLGLSFLKAELILHRPYLLLGRTDIKYEYSRRVCLNAASEMLDFQQRLDVDIQPGGKLWAPGWHVFTLSWYMSSIVAQDFLLATTILILDLNADLTSPLLQAPSEATSGLRLDRQPPSRQEIIQILRGTQEIWYKASKRSHEARKVAEAVRLVLNKASAEDQRTGDPYQGPTTHDSTNLVSPAPSFDLDDFTAEASNPSIFENSIYANPFATYDMPMDLGSFPDTFSWDPMPSNMQTHPYDDIPQRPSF
ncbi:hypothetical protein FB567DRAFT_600035 [Paraphoma chrysanthemicola]|uniref:Zn(2)-C6 fungal-type domain-containing protein n=1 Tax=Paraphoma chrysanthemicola TaxID=798071 RepID=A0A8K0W3C2_9PLEO|nr:hypothetical protein FB567DRAFT_600035 [Paraphoma chrysanthemicola]